MIDDKLIQSLTQEERDLLLKIFTKITEAEKNSVDGDDDLYYHSAPKEKTDDEVVEQIEKDSTDQYEEIRNGGAVLDCPVELVFNVNCIVYEKNPLGEVVNQNDLFIKTYHVPLINQIQIKDYIDGFFRKFTKTLESVAKEVIE